MNHLIHLWYILYHKYLTYRYGRELGVPRLQLLLHDWSKLLPAEWFPSVAFFHGDRTPKVREAFARARLLHYSRNKHHPEYWVLKNRVSDAVCLPMPQIYACEMLADWYAGNQAQKSRLTVREWYIFNRMNIPLHPETRAWVERQLDI